MPIAASNRSDLDLWLEKAEAMGELQRITEEVDPDLEIRLRLSLAFLCCPYKY